MQFPMKRAGARGRWLKEPVVHFMVLGVAVFAAYRWLTPTIPANRIMLSDDLVRGLRQDHVRRSGEFPTAAQEAALLQRYVDTEILYREALALGLDRGDIIVRRRLVQKMEFILEGAEPAPEANDTALQTFLDTHIDRYAVAERAALTHIFASADKHGPNAERAAAAWREQLLAGADPARLGDPFARGRDFPPQTERELAGAFGPAFAASVMHLPVGTWSDPLRSSYGVHLVQVTKRSPGHRPTLAEVRATVLRDWREQQRSAGTRAALRRLRGQYDIHVATVAPDAPAEVAAVR